MDFAVYPKLQKLVDLLSKEEYPVEPQDLQTVASVDIFIGRLTAGEAQLFVFWRQEAEALGNLGLEFDELDDEQRLRVEVTAYLQESFWQLLRDRLADKVGPDTGIRADYQVVNRKRVHDCGCGRGAGCGAVKMGIINPETGERRQPTEMDIAALSQLGTLLSAGMRRGGEIIDT